MGIRDRVISKIARVCAGILGVPLLIPVLCIRCGDVALAGEVVQLSSFGAKCDGNTDDTAAIRKWLKAAAPFTQLVAPPGVCVFKTALTVPGGGLTNVSIVGAGPTMTVFKYAGSSTTVDLFTIGDGAYHQYVGWHLADFSLDSGTKMTAGTALHLKGFGLSQIRNVLVPGQMNAQIQNNLWNAVWFDAGSQNSWSQGEADAQNVAVSVSGNVALAFPAGDDYLDNFKISFSSVGIHIGGYTGAINCSNTEVIGNGVNLLVDTTLASIGNQGSVFGPSCYFDSAKNDNVVLNDAIANDGQKLTAVMGEVASSGKIGIHIQAWRNGANPGTVAVTSGQVADSGSDNIRLEDGDTILVVNGSSIAYAGLGTGVGFGLNATVAYPKVTMIGNTFQGNASGDLAPSILTSTGSINDIVRFCKPAVAIGGSSNGITYSRAACQSQFIGNYVSLAFSIVLTSKGSNTGAVTITGLPIASGTASNILGVSGQLGSYENFVGLTGAPGLWIGAGSNHIGLVQSGPTASMALSDKNLSDSSVINGTILYPR